MVPGRHSFVARYFFIFAQLIHHNPSLTIVQNQTLLLLIPVFLFGMRASSLAQQQEDAVAIVRKADERARGKTSIAEMTITTVRPKWTRSMDIKAWTKGNEMALILVKSPAKDKGTTFLKRKKEVWNWLPSLERTIKLPPSMMSQSWMGTDFTNDDLVKESSIVDDYVHKLLGSEKQGDRDCHKIELTPKPEAAVVWGKVVVWVDKKDYIQLRTEFYDENGALSQTMIGADLKMLGGKLLPSRIEMTPADKKGHKTEIAYKSLEFDKPLADSFFTTENMTKVK
ncbi:MAG: outer membrane lipoprotein-sorting protein [Saprospiraceae bacterium]|nr:outer membrane lipoprotein-sorting protein [Saprospiraceae bacterium]